MSSEIEMTEISAATRVSTNPDILAIITGLLNPASLLACMSTSTELHDAAVRRLYRRIDVRRDLDPFLRVIFPLDEPPFLHKVPSHPEGCETLPETSTSSFSKLAALRHVKVLNLFEHEKAVCPGLAGLHVLENLETLHLAGGGRPKGVHRGSGFCGSETCPVVSQACERAKRVILRGWSSTSQCLLPDLPMLEKVELMIRPCQLPSVWYTSHVSPGYDGGDPMIPVSFIDEPPSGPFRAISRPFKLDLIFWDEFHSHRVDLTHPLVEDEVSEQQKIRRDREYPRKDCSLCNQNGRCKKIEVNPRTQLPELMRRLGRWSDLTLLRVYNVGRTIRVNSGRCLSHIEIEGVRNAMVAGFKEGRKERTRVGGGEEQAGKTVEITFHTSEEYLDQTDSDRDLDDRTKEYWDLLSHPSEKIVALRNELLKEEGFELDDIEGMAAALLSQYLKWVDESKRVRNSGHA